MAKRGNTTPAGAAGAAAHPKADANLPIKRYSKEAIEDRQREVWSMHMEGTSQTVIAGLLKVSLKTVQRDIASIREEQEEHARLLRTQPELADVDVGLTAKKLETIAETAMMEYALSQQPAVKDRFLNTAMKALASRHKVLAEAGYLPKAGIESTKSRETKISFEARFGEDNPLSVLDTAASRRKVMAALEAAIKVGVMNKSGGTIDIEAEVRDAEPGGDE